MRETAAMRYNRKMDALFQPEIDRLKKVEAIAGEVFDALNEVKSSERWAYINAITKVIDKRMLPRETNNS